MARLSSKDTTAPSSSAVDTVPVAPELPKIGETVEARPVAPPKPVPMPKVGTTKVKVEGPQWVANLEFANVQTARTAIAAIANKAQRGQECQIIDLHAEHWFTATYHVTVS
jgi:hypothetical protein